MKFNYTRFYADINSIRQQRGDHWIAVFMATGVHDVARRAQQSIDGSRHAGLSQNDCQNLAQYAGLALAEYEVEA